PETPPPDFVPPPDVAVETPTTTNNTAITSVQRTQVTTTGVKNPTSRCAQDMDSYYPATEKRLNHEGRVVVHMCVEADGSISEATVTQSSGFPALDEAAVKYLRACRWSAATISGQKQAHFCYDQPIKMQIKGK